MISRVWDWLSLEPVSYTHLDVYKRQVVGRYNKIEDAFVGRYLTHEGESVAEAKQRLQKQHSNTIEDSEQKAKDAGNCACEDVSAAEEEKE